MKLFSCVSFIIYSITNINEQFLVEMCGSVNINHFGWIMMKLEPLIGDTSCSLCYQELMSHLKQWRRTKLTLPATIQSIAKYLPYKEVLPCFWSCYRLGVTKNNSGRGFPGVVLSFVCILSLLLSYVAIKNPLIWRVV